VHKLEIVEWLGDKHSYKPPTKELAEEQREALKKALHSVDEAVPLENEPESATDTPPAFVLSMTVSGGTYVRSIVHDLAHAVGSAGHVVTLTRSRQGQFSLDEGKDDELGCVPWSVIEKATENVGETDEDGWTDWERAVFDHLEVIENK